MIQPDGEYRHKWRVGDIVIWDNRCSYHRAAGDYPPHEDRIHWRVSIKERGGAEAGGGVTFAVIRESARPGDEATFDPLGTICSAERATDCFVPGLRGSSQ